MKACLAWTAIGLLCLWLAFFGPPRDGAAGLSALLSAQFALAHWAIPAIRRWRSSP